MCGIISLLLVLKFLQKLPALLPDFLRLVNSLGAVLAENDPKRQNNQLEIQQQRIILNINEIQPQLIIGAGIVLSKNLGVAG